jgi:hypothetical protein
MTSRTAASDRDISCGGMKIQNAFGLMPGACHRDNERVVQ